jgi:hypothetical protein
MKISAIECPKCEAIIYSRARHDFRYCPCGDVAVDGGFDYKKVSYHDARPRHIWVEVPEVTKNDLYQDWNKCKDKFGIILHENRQKTLEEVVEIK